MANEIKLGSLRNGDEQRDAIHIAVAPMECGTTLRPGSWVKLDIDGKLIAADKKDAIGIIDPFLRVTKLTRGDKVWLCMIPYTITSLRHEWTHPAFETPVTREKSEAEEYLRNWCSEVGIQFDEMIRIATLNATDPDGWHYFTCRGYATPGIVWNERETFWRNFEIFTGIKQKDTDATFVSCSC